MSEPETQPNVNCLGNSIGLSLSTTSVVPKHSPYTPEFGRAAVALSCSLSLRKLYQELPSAAIMATGMPQGNAVFPRSHVGFDSITQQIEKKLLKRGFQFNVICVGTCKEEIWSFQF